ncbi:hypothetical protein ACH4SP_36735 [Streptomyces sp. NPDC021093]|uniref:hypothetical protein n=1 Tax=Streptomyces sp. NPDC021093 TaxID=3365112 RepID=UPI003790E374
MKKIILAAIPVLALSFGAPAAHADDNPFEGPVSAADNWNFSAGVVAIQEAAVVPVLGGFPGYVGDHDNNASNGNVIDHS